MRNKSTTLNFYTEYLGFHVFGSMLYNDYLMLQYDNVEIHFFLFPSLDPLTNYGQVYFRVIDIEALYQHYLKKGVPIHANGKLAPKPWGTKEFAILDPDHNLLTFGEIWPS